MLKDPFHIQWHITNQCNLRCKHCYQEDFSKNRDLDWDGLRKVSENILATMGKWDKTACIHVTGGEPLLKPELFFLLDYLDRESMVEELGIITNGLLLDQKLLHRLSDISKFKKIKISLDGAKAEVNDSIRQKGTFDGVMETLSLIKKGKRFETILMFTVMKRNYKDLPSIIRLCQDLGIHGLILERFIPLGRGKEAVGEVLEREQWKELVETLVNLFEIGSEECSLPPYQAFQIRFNAGAPELLGAPCVIGRDGLCIMPDGSVFPCRRFPVSIGNLMKESLKEIWESSSLLDQLRKKENLKGKCGRCGIEDCRGCRSLVFALTADYLEEDPHCWSFKD